MNTLSIVGVAGDYRLLRVHSVYPITVVAKMHGDFMTFCYDDMYHGYNANETPFQAACSDIKLQAKNHFWPYENKSARKISIVNEIMALGMHEVEETFIEWPINFPDYLKDC